MRRKEPSRWQHCVLNPGKAALDHLPIKPVFPARITVKSLLSTVAKSTGPLQFLLQMVGLCCFAGWPYADLLTLLFVLFGIGPRGWGCVTCRSSPFPLASPSFGGFPGLLLWFKFHKIPCIGLFQCLTQPQVTQALRKDTKKMITDRRAASRSWWWWD